ncbi:hypothetical protein CSB69_2055 [Morganella morganii]|nr:hypothetical protein CSB69_2055 [Morganella morganii]
MGDAATCPTEKSDDFLYFPAQQPTFLSLSLFTSPFVSPLLLPG